MLKKVLWVPFHESGEVNASALCKKTSFYEFPPGSAAFTFLTSLLIDLLKSVSCIPKSAIVMLSNYNCYHPCPLANAA